MTSPIFDTLPGSPNGMLEGIVAASTIGGITFGPTAFNAQEYRRDPRLVRASGLDMYKVQLHSSGTVSGRCDDAPFRAEAGDISVFDLTRPMRSQALVGGTTVTLVVPRQLIDKAARGRTVHGTILKAREPITQLLGQLFLTMTELSGDLTGADEYAVEETISDLLAAALVHRSVEHPFEHPAMFDALRRRALNYIDAHLGDRRLGPDMLSQALQVSRKHLYRIFTADGGVARVIRERRLEACYRELANPASTHKQFIKEIAHRYAFAGSGQFLRAFRAHYEMTPSEVRANGFPNGFYAKMTGSLQSHLIALSKQIGHAQGALQNVATG